MLSKMKKKCMQEFNGRYVDATLDNFYKLIELGYGEGNGGVLLESKIITITEGKMFLYEDGTAYKANHEYISDFMSLFPDNLTIDDLEDKKMKIEDLIYLIKLNEPKMLPPSLLLRGIYLIDWKYTLLNNETLLNIDWENTNYGPGFDDYKELVNNIENINSFSEDYIPNQQVLDVIEFVAEKTERLKYTELTNLAFSTYPMISTERYDKLNIQKKSIEYKDTLNQHFKTSAENLISLPKKKKTITQKVADFFDRD